MKIQIISFLLLFVAIVVSAQTQEPMEMKHKYASVVEELSRDYPKNTAPLSKPFREQYRLVLEGESFKWIERKKENWQATDIPQHY